MYTRYRASASTWFFPLQAQVPTRHLVARRHCRPRGRRGEFSFKVGRREIGHLHGDRAAHFGFAKACWHSLFKAGRIDYHPVFPGRPGFGARRIDVIALIRMNYERVVAKHGLPEHAAA
jgi:hypothetical protein